MRRRVPLTNLNPRDHRAPVPSGAGMGAAAVLNLPSPVSREEEEAKARIWEPVSINTEMGHVLTPATDPTANAPKKAGWPKGKKRGPRHAD
jgi:hypothetical protein